MARGESLLRQWKLLNLLQSRRSGMALRDLAGLSGYGERTIQRDLSMLKEVGFPVSFDTDEFGKRFWNLPPDYIKRQGVQLSLTEALSLHFARQLLAPLAGTSLADDFDQLADRIESLLPESALQHFSDLRELILVRSHGPVDYRRHRQTVGLIAQGIRERLVLEMTYHAAWRGERYTTLVHPYGLVYYEGNLYLAGHSERSKAFRMFKVTRIHDLRPTKTSFQRPKNFRLEERFTGGFGIMDASGPSTKIEVEFDARVAFLVEEREWHKSQRLQREADGRLIATFQLADLLEFKQWVMGFGQHARVRRPESLRQEIHKTFLAAAERYEDGDGRR